MKKRLCILGSTGSIGRKVLEVVSDFPDRLEVVGLSTHSNVPLLSQQVRRFRPKMVAVSDPGALGEARRRFGRGKVRCHSGPEGLVDLVGDGDVDLVVLAVVGGAGLQPLLAALEARKTVCLANKEPLVMAGELVTARAKAAGVSLIPIDSEHSAIFQCLAGRSSQTVGRIFLTGSGGPLRQVAQRRFSTLTPKRVLQHPHWKMGKKITVDSATLMNKGLEVIEARWLFGLPQSSIEILIHPEAVIHSLVEFVDGALLAQLAVPDMRLPIQYALTFPDRWTTGLACVNLAKLGKLTFERPNGVKFPCLPLALEAGRAGGTMPAVLNAANEEAVAGFLSGRISFSKIPVILEKTLRSHRNITRPRLRDIFEADSWARQTAGCALLNGRVS